MRDDPDPYNKFLWGFQNVICMFFCGSKSKKTVRLNHESSYPYIKYGMNVWGCVIKLCIKRLLALPKSIMQIVGNFKSKYSCYH